MKASFPYTAQLLISAGRRPPVTEQEPNPKEPLHFSLVVARHDKENAVHSVPLPSQDTDVVKSALETALAALA